MGVLNVTFSHFLFKLEFKMQSRFLSPESARGDRDKRKLSLDETRSNSASNGELAVDANTYAGLRSVWRDLLSSLYIDYLNKNKQCLVDVVTSCRVRYYINVFFSLIGAYVSLRLR